MKAIPMIEKKGFNSKNEEIITNVFDGVSYFVLLLPFA